MREQVKAMTVEKREYEERKYQPLRPPPPFSCERNQSPAPQGDALKYAALTYQIKQLEAQLNTLYPHIWKAWGSDPANGMFWDSFREASQQANVLNSVGWHDGCVPIEAQCHDDDYGETDGHNPLTRLQRLAGRLKESRASIRALTPPEDDEDGQENELPIAA